MPASRELTVVGYYPSPFLTIDDKRRFLKDPLTEWFPDSGDMLSVARNGFQRVRPGSVELVRDVWTLIDFVIAQPQRSVSRLNIITHGSPGLISLRGSIEPPDQTNPDASQQHRGRLVFARGTDAGISLPAIEMLVRPGSWPNGKTVDELRLRFTSQAALHVYSCNSGAGFLTPSKELLERTATLFQTRVFGWSDIVGYFIDNVDDRQDNWKYEVSVGPSTDPGAIRAKDFHKLDATARRLGKLVDVPRPSP
jgi:hypothetical protein